MYKEPRQLSPTEAAYIAGIIDGEGTISLSRRHKNDNRQLVISVSSTEIELLEYVKTTVGDGKYTDSLYQERLAFIRKFMDIRPDTGG